MLRSDGACVPIGPSGLKQEQKAPQSKALLGRTVDNNMKPESIKVQVHYMAASKPFKTEEDPSTTAGQLKAAVLDAFGLKEDGNKVYKLFHQKTELTNLSQTLGEIAGHQRDLNLKLEEVLVQGA